VTSRRDAAGAESKLKLYTFPEILPIIPRQVNTVKAYKEADLQWKLRKQLKEHIKVFSCL